jgi:hypothetical protein
VRLVKQRCALVIALIAVVAGLTACEAEKSSRDARPRVVEKGDEYVALGDSYTAAPQTGDNADRSGCQNTEVNYPHRVAEAIGLDLVDNSCNGASTNALTNPQRIPSIVPGQVRENPPQLDDVDDDTDLVTIRLGANDYGLFARIIQCARNYAGQSGSPCTDLDANGGANSLDARLADVRDNLDTALEEIGRRAPDATIVVLGYPHVAPDEGTCDLLPVPDEDYDYVRRIIEGLNTDLEGAAEAAGATYIDMYAVSEGHDICGEQPWVAGAPIRPTGATAWHPYAAESQAAAELILEALET